jgi:hypothetical protein
MQLATYMIVSKDANDSFVQDIECCCNVEVGFAQL